MDGDATDAAVLVAPPSRRRAALYVAIPVGVVMAALVALLVTREPSVERIADSPLLGRQAPAITGETLEGEAFSLDDYRGKWVVVNFFGSWCVPCVQEHPELLSFDRRHRQIGDAQLVQVVFQDDPDAVRKFYDENDGGWPVVIGDDGALAISYSVTAPPETYLIAPNGTVAARIIGQTTAFALDRLLVDLGDLDAA